MSRFCLCGHPAKNHSRIDDREWCVYRCPCDKFEFAADLEDTDERELRRPPYRPHRRSVYPRPYNPQKRIRPPQQAVAVSDYVWGMPGEFWALVAVCAGVAMLWLWLLAR